MWWSMECRCITVSSLAFQQGSCSSSFSLTMEASSLLLCPRAATLWSSRENCMALSVYVSNPVLFPVPEAKRSKEKGMQKFFTCSSLSNKALHNEFFVIFFLEEVSGKNQWLHEPLWWIERPVWHWHGTTIKISQSCIRCLWFSNSSHPSFPDTFYCGWELRFLSWMREMRLILALYNVRWIRWGKPGNSESLWSCFSLNFSVFFARKIERVDGHPYRGHIGNLSSNHTLAISYRGVLQLTWLSGLGKWTFEPTLL